MRLHYILLMAAATLLASSDVVSASADSTQMKLSTTATDTVPAARSLAGASNEVSGKRSLRTVKEDEAEDEERFIQDFAKGTTARALRKYLVRNNLISKATSKQLKSSGFTAKEIAEMYTRYIKLTS
ncbi:hypothetical protein KRP22_011394 [Phytophthora ramorum]|uniref:uncharacterized protein n=1 Tax=Phytophthora ramorum TaxID=164328 RepID=UPI0030A90425|nr:hypothetical protein KRP23_3147 [Phytophthora ramorum]KAH7499982.1 hypothetical protein KRP22_10596 [Phytophthora ramorum]